jgi:hypothetical protein
MARRRTDTRVFVCGDAHADSRAADQDTAIDLSRANLMGYNSGNVRIVDAIRVVRSAITDLVSQPLQQLDDVLFDGKSAVVAADGNLHVLIPT